MCLVDYGLFFLLRELVYGSRDVEVKYQAICDFCGWVGPERETDYRADLDRAEHKKNCREFKKYLYPFLGECCMAWGLGGSK